jgi:hypothetical protein
VGGACGTHGRGGNVYRVLVGKPEGKRPPERPRRRWEDGIKCTLGRLTGGVWSGFTWLRIGIVGGLLWTRWNNCQEFLILRLLINCWADVSSNMCMCACVRAHVHVCYLSLYVVSANRVSIPGKAGFFSSHERPAWPAFCLVSIGILSTSLKRPGRDADHSPPSSAEVRKE